MRSDTSPENPAASHVQPIARLKWEHLRLLDEFGKLVVSARQATENCDGIGDRARTVLKFLERHQEAEERFLFPLVPGLGDKLFTGLRKDHHDFLHASDALVSFAQSGNQESLAKSLDVFRIHLETHFAKEEAAVFETSADILSPAQMDILRIKFASREAPEI